MGPNTTEPGLEQLGSPLAIVLGVVAGLVVLVVLEIAILTVWIINHRMNVVQQESVIQEHRYDDVLPLYVYSRIYTNSSMYNYCTHEGLTAETPIQ